MKHLIKLSLLLLAFLLPATASAYDFEVDGIYYNILNDNEVEVTYQYLPSDYGDGVDTYFGNVVIPATVTKNGITYSVTSIGDDAFAWCSSLNRITIPSTVKSIGNSVFCHSTLTDIIIPNSVTSIGSGVFYDCWQLTNVSIPNSVTSISDGMFELCVALTGISIPNSVTSIGNSAFSDCRGLSNITIPESVTSIGHSAFYCCGCLTNIIIPTSVTSIGNSSFYDCRSLTSITIPNSVTSIGNSAFSNCRGLTSITIPSSVTSIDYSVFYGCSGLTSIAIPNSVKSIGGNAFYGCSGLTSISIPNSVTSIGVKAFFNCPLIEKVNCAAETPPSCNGSIDMFSTNVYNHASLCVPKNSLRAYMADQSWGQFINIEELVTSEDVLATGISFNQSQMSMVMGSKSQLFATVFPDSTTNKAVTWASNNPSVVTVDNNGNLTALSVGTATITAMTTDGSNLSASCVVTVTHELSDNGNYLLMADLTAFHGDTIVIPVAMVNEASIISFQTDIYLPEGLELLQEDGEYLIDPSPRMTTTHSIMSNAVSNGSIRVVCYSANYKPFKGESGDDLFYLTVKVADDAEGDYTFQLKNTLFTTSDFEEIAVPDAAAIVNVMSYIPGDANNSGTVTVTDVVVASQYILELNPEPFNFTAADVNEDGSITVTDVSRIAWMVLNPASKAPLLRAPALWNNGDQMSGNDLTLASGETRRVSIALDNALVYSAFQLDLQLPEGLTSCNFALTDRASSHAFDVNMLHNGAIRALCYSPALTAIRGHEGALLTFDVTATGTVNGNITVDGIELVTTDCQTMILDGFVIGVNTVTSVNELSDGKTVARVDYFNLAGQQIDRPDSGVALVVTTYTDGTRTTTKLIR